MKALKIIGIILLVLILIILVLGLFAPKEYLVERSITIDAPQSIVFRHVQFWKNWQPWSPWANIDSTMKVTYEGVDGTKGSLYKWTGKDVGEGMMSNTGIKYNEEIAYHLQFIKPWESEADGYVRLAPETGGTKVTWGMFGKEGFFGSIINWIMNIDKMLGGDFEKGLALLKQRVDDQMHEIGNYQIQQIDFSAQT
ncbi:SRPBCC family protein [candidate division KSB1 bacterium]|nr:SRPBCC family protein [candidate division KSB1 bacterium]